MKLSFKCVLLLAVAIVSSTSSWAYHFKQGGLYYTIISGTEVKIEPSDDYQSMFTVLEIPEKVSYNGSEYKVTQIAERAFFFGTKMTKLILPATIERIGSQAFGCQVNLDEVTCYAVTPPYCEDGGSISFRPFCDAATLYVPYGSGEVYRQAGGWKWINNVVELAPDHFLLTIMTDGTVNAVQKVEPGKTYTFTFEPYPGKSLRAVIFNNVDVTSQVHNGEYTTPAINSNATIRVIFQ